MTRYSERADLRRERSPALEQCCGGALMADSDAVGAWVARLAKENPEWTQRRLWQRATIEALKAKKP